MTPTTRKAIEGILAYFNSGNALPVEKATIRGDSQEVQALRAALEQPEVEPYGWHVTGSNELLRGEYAQSDAESDAERCGGTARAVALYTAPPPPADVPLLTDDEIKDAIRHLYKHDVVLRATFVSSIADFRAIEQAVRQKAGLK